MIENNNFKNFKLIKSLNFNLIFLKNFCRVILYLNCSRPFLHIKLNKESWIFFVCLNFLTLPITLFQVVDGCQYKSTETSINLIFNTNCLLTEVHTSVLISIENNQFFLDSLTSIVFSCNWLERELSEFTGLKFIGSSDTRRLLLDYYDNKKMHETHDLKDKSYNNLFFESFLTF